MSKRPNPAVVLGTKLSLIQSAIQGRDEASSSSLSASYGLPIEHVRKILQQQGVRDNG